MNITKETETDFDFHDENGNSVQDIRKCNDCGWISTAKHFGDSVQCAFCGSNDIERNR